MFHSFRRVPVVALILDRVDWSSPLGWEKIFGWIAVRRAIPAEKENTYENQIRPRKYPFFWAPCPISVLETHTINAKLNLPILPKGVFWRGRSSVSFAECHTDRFKTHCQISLPKNIYSLVDSEEGWEGGFLIVDNLVISQLFAPWSLSLLICSAKLEHV